MFVWERQYYSVVWLSPKHSSWCISCHHLLWVQQDIARIHTQMCYVDNRLSIYCSNESFYSFVIPLTCWCVPHSLLQVYLLSGTDGRVLWQTQCQMVQMYSSLTLKTTGPHDLFLFRTMGQVVNTPPLPAAHGKPTVVSCSLKAIACSV